MATTHGKRKPSRTPSMLDLVAEEGALLASSPLVKKSPRASDQTPSPAAATLAWRSLFAQRPNVEQFEASKALPLVEISKENVDLAAEDRDVTTVVAELRVQLAASHQREEALKEKVASLVKEMFSLADSCDVKVVTLQAQLADRDEECKAYMTAKGGLQAVMRGMAAEIEILRSESKSASHSRVSSTYTNATSVSEASELSQDTERPAEAECGAPKSENRAADLFLSPDAAVGDGPAVADLRRAHLRVMELEEELGYAREEKERSDAARVAMEKACEHTLQESDCRLADMEAECRAANARIEALERALDNAAKTTKP